MIRYVTGDATRPANGSGIVAHICNDLGIWSGGFVLAVSRRWPLPEAEYRRNWGPLGSVQIVRVSPSLFVANMQAQHGFPTRERPCAVDYGALSVCLSTVFAEAEERGLAVHMPRIGCGIGGGEWERVATIIESCMGSVSVTVYELPAVPRA